MYCKYLSQNYFLHISAQYYQNLYTNYYYYLQQCNLEKSSLNSNLYGCKSNLHYYKQNLAQCRKTNLDTTISIARTTPSTTKIETTTSSEKCMIILIYFFFKNFIQVLIGLYDDLNIFLDKHLDVLFREEISSCSAWCGNGTKTIRKLTCDQTDLAGNCIHELRSKIEHVPCFDRECPGRYGQWSSWSNCTQTCITANQKSIQTRIRNCEGKNCDQDCYGGTIGISFG